MYCQTCINSLLLGLWKSFPTNQLWPTWKLWYNNSSQKVLSNLCPTTVPQLSFPLFIHTLAPWCLSFSACFTDDQRQASITKTQSTTKTRGTNKAWEHIKPRRNNCRDFIMHFLFSEKLYMTFTVRKLAFWPAFGIGSNGSYWDRQTF